MDISTAKACTEAANEREQKLKQEAMNQCNAQRPYGAALGGQMAMSKDLEPARQSLRERVQSGLRRAQREAIKHDRLSELNFLLEKYPEIARMLELIEALGQ